MTEDDNRERLVLALTEQVTFQHGEEPYPELRTALETLIDSVCGAGKTPDGVDWAAIVSEATSLRPHHD